MATDRAFVVDTSVAVKWYLSEDAESGQRQSRAALARAVEGDIALHAPELIRYEVGNVLARRVGNPAKCFGEFLALPLRVHVLSDAQHQRALALQLDRRIFYYDAAYLALAESLDLPLLTDDRKLVGASRGRAVALVDFPAAQEEEGSA